jgi:hypothetical protein
VRLEFRGAQISSDGGLLVIRALDVRVADLFSEKVEGEAWFVNRTLVRGDDGLLTDGLRELNVQN